VKERALLRNFARQLKAEAHRKRAILAVVLRRIQMLQIVRQATVGGRNSESHTLAAEQGPTWAARRGEPKEDGASTLGLCRPIGKLTNASGWQMFAFYFAQAAQIACP
jgi:hypothetical protein